MWSCSPFAHYVISIDRSDKIWVALHKLNINSSYTNQTFVLLLYSKISIILQGQPCQLLSLKLLAESVLWSLSYETDQYKDVAVERDLRLRLYGKIHMDYGVLPMKIECFYCAKLILSIV